jgi:hypothetical protein
MVAFPLEVGGLKCSLHYLLLNIFYSVTGCSKSPDAAQHGISQIQNSGLNECSVNYSISTSPSQIIIHSQ